MNLAIANGMLGRLLFGGRAIGAVVAQLLYTQWVGGSNPSSPTISTSNDGKIRPRFEGVTTGFFAVEKRVRAEHFLSRTLFLY